MRFKRYSLKYPSSKSSNNSNLLHFGKYLCKDTQSCVLDKSLLTVYNICLIHKTINKGGKMKTKDYNLIDWSELFYYDESSPSCLRRKVAAKAKGCRVDNVVGSLRIAAKGGGYYIIGYDGKLWYAHRIIWLLFNGRIPESMVINHIDCNPSNNKIENLELVTKKTNNRSSKYVHGEVNVRNTSGKNGVRFERVVVNRKKNEYFYWTASWCCPETGKLKQKRFKIKDDFSDLEEQKKKAIEYRRLIEDTILTPEVGYRRTNE